MRLSRESGLAVVFVGIVTLSSAYIAVAAYNYGTYYWSARDNLLGSPGRVDAVRNETDAATGNVNVFIDVSIFNPSAYEGFSVNQFDLTFFFYHNGNVTQALFSGLREQLLPTLTLNYPLPARSGVNATLTVNLDASQSKMFRDFSAVYSGEVSARTYLMTVVDSFLNPAMGSINTSSVQDVPLSLAG